MIWSIFLKAILHRIYLADYEYFVSFVLFAWIAFQELLRIFNVFLIALMNGWLLAIVKKTVRLTES